MQKEIDNHAIPLYKDILNRGVRQGVFRKDINIDIVSKVIIGNLNVLLDARMFPPTRYSLGEVTRCIYLYYFRGLCQESHEYLVDTYFSKNSF